MALSLSSRSAHVPAINMRVLDFVRVSKLDPGLRFEMPAGVFASARARLETGRTTTGQTRPRCERFVWRGLAGGDGALGVTWKRSARRPPSANVHSHKNRHRRPEKLPRFQPP